MAVQPGDVTLGAVFRNLQFELLGVAVQTPRSGQWNLLYVYSHVFRAEYTLASQGGMPLNVFVDFLNNNGFELDTSVYKTTKVS